jgi:hypothetical protein
MRALLLVAAAVCSAACGGQLLAQANPTGPSAGSIAGSRALPAGVTMLQRASIPDPGVIAQTTAMTALIPAGWSSRGGVVASQDVCSEPYAVDWLAVSPDGLSSVSIFPTEIWQWSNTGLESTCKQAASASARDYLVARLQRIVPGVRFLDYRPRPDLTKSTEERAPTNRG